VAVVETVRGPVELSDLGQTLMHEHVYVLSTEHVQNYGIGSWWDEEFRVADAIAKLNSLYAKGIHTIVDPTVWGLGRYIPRIQRIAAQTPVNIIGLDVFNPTAERVKTIAVLASRGYAPSMVLAHDANCFIDYWGGLHDTMRPQALPNWHYEHISDDVLPALLAAGVSQAQIDTMMLENPVRYFTKGGAA
jgi:predicted metal-dependent phosphotriesterase family hydrolase